MLISFDEYFTLELIFVFSNFTNFTLTFQKLDCISYFTLRLRTRTLRVNVSTYNYLIKRSVHSFSVSILDMFRLDNTFKQNLLFHTTIISLVTQITNLKVAKLRNCLFIFMGLMVLLAHFSPVDLKKCQIRHSQFDYFVITLFEIDM